MIKDKIKVVIWDLDDTLWKGTLAEGDDVQLLENRVAIIKELNIWQNCDTTDYRYHQTELLYLLRSLKIFSPCFSKQ